MTLVGVGLPFNEPTFHTLVLPLQVGMAMGQVQMEVLPEPLLLFGSGLIGFGAGLTFRCGWPDRPYTRLVFICSTQTSNFPKVYGGAVVVNSENKLYGIGLNPIWHILSFFFEWSSVSSSFYLKRIQSISKPVTGIEPTCSCHGVGLKHKS